MRKNIQLHVTLGLFLLVLISCAEQKKPMVKEEEKTTTSVNLYYQFDTSDELIWNETRYLIAQSPLAVFGEYKKLYPELPYVDIEGEAGGYGYKVGDVYRCKWLLKENRLYMIDIETVGNIRKTLESAYPKKDPDSFPGGKFPEEKDYQAMERFTDRKFSKTIASLEKEPQVGTYGAILADWFTGDLTVKKTRDSKTSHDEWEKISYDKLTFKNGELVSKQELVPEKK